MSDFDGRVAIVTGAGQGIGRAYAHAYAGAGIIPVIVDIDPENVKSVGDEIKQEFGMDCLAIEADITNPDQIATVTGRTIERHDRIDSGASERRGCCRGR